MPTSTARSASPNCAPDSTEVSAWGLTLLRVSVGTMWVAHALLKWVVFTLPGTALFFVSVGLPGALAVPVFVVELLGGVAVLMGVYARQVALALVPVLVVAAWVHIPNGWVHTAAGGGWEYPAFLIAASLSLWLMGDGAAALRRSHWLVPRARRT